MESNQKVYLIYHADLMNANAANRLLKFLEEPSQKTTAILMTKTVKLFWIQLSLDAKLSC